MPPRTQLFFLLVVLALSAGQPLWGDPPSTEVLLREGVLEIVDLSGSKSDLLRLCLDAADPSQLLIEGDGHVLTSKIPGAIGDGSASLRVPLAGVASIALATHGGDDCVTLDLQHGLFPVDLHYDGGVQDTAKGDIVRIQGDGQCSISYAPDKLSSTSGRLVMRSPAGSEACLNFTGLEPVDVIGFAILTFNPLGAEDVIRMDPGFDSTTGTLSAIVISGTSGGVAFETLHSVNNTNLIINTGTITDGDDDFTLGDLSNGHGHTSVAIVSGTGNDMLHAEGTSGADAVVLTNSSVTYGFRVDFDNLTSLDVSGNDGNDSVTIDFSVGNFTMPISYDGGGQTSSPGDVLVLTGGTFADVGYTFTNANDGSIDITGNATITYTGLE